MFEEEIEMEKQQSSVVPLLLVVALVVATVGAAVYFLIQGRQVLTTQEATNLAVEVLKAQGPATVKFHTGAGTQHGRQAGRPALSLVGQSWSREAGEGQRSDRTRCPNSQRGSTLAADFGSKAIQGEGRYASLRGSARGKKADYRLEGHHDRHQTRHGTVHLEMGNECAG